MSPNNHELDLSTRFHRFVEERWGLVGLVVLFCAAAPVFLWWNWDHVKTLPGVPSVISLLPQKGLPQSGPRHFVVAVGHLENDQDHRYEQLIPEALKEFEGIDTLLFDRTIPLDGPRPGESVRIGHERAREYLEESGAHVLIWGTVLSHQDESLPKLYLTSSPELEVGERSGRYKPTEDLAARGESRG